MGAQQSSSSSEESVAPSSHPQHTLMAHTSSRKDMIMATAETELKKRMVHQKTLQADPESIVSMSSTLNAPLDTMLSVDNGIAPAAEMTYSPEEPILGQVSHLALAGQFSILPPHVCLYLLKYHLVHLPTAFALAKTCKYWYTLFNDESIFRLAAQRRFRMDTSELQIRLMYESMETSWKDVYLRLDQGQTSWKGFAIDRATNQFLPYPMEIIVSHSTRSLDKKSKNASILKTEFHGMCRWESLQNSLTRIQGAIFDPKTPQDSRFSIDTFLNTTAPRTCTFTETSIVRGEDIAIPNNYFGMMVGPLLLGMYDPGHPQFLGCFILMMEEALANKSMVSYVEKSIWAKRKQQQDSTLSSTNVTKQFLDELIYSQANTAPSVFIPRDKSERTRKLAELASMRQGKSILQEKKSYRGILTHAVEGDKKGYHIEWEILQVDSHQVQGIFSIMLVSCKNGNLSTMKTFPCKLLLTIDIDEHNNKDDYIDSQRVLQGLTQSTPTTSSANKTMASSAELYTHYKNPTFTRLNTSSPASDDSVPDLLPVHEDEAIENQWLQEHIPIESHFTLIRMGGVLAGFFNEPKVGVFYLNIE